MQTFNDRFILKYPALSSVDIDQLTDSQLETLAPDVKVFASMVKGYSVIIRRKPTKEIYNLVTQQVDPRISLILATARDNVGIRLFPNLDTVKSVMFGPDNQAAEFEDTDLNIFVEGVKRAAAALTASILIGQLAQIEEQAKHSIILESQAIADLDRILKVPDLQAALEASTSAKANTEDSLSFYFEKKSLNLTSSTLRAELFMPSSLTTGWSTVGEYTGKFTTANIAADLADAINSVTLVNNTSNIIAAPVLAAGTSLHKIDFLARERDVNISAEVISFRVSILGSDEGVVPFKWGLDSSSLENETINSLILTVQQGKAGAVSGSASSTSKAGSSQPVVLYFRRASVNPNDEIVNFDGTLTPKSIWSSTGNLKFRISPNQAASVDVAIPYLVTQNDKNRPSQVAEALLTGMYTVKGATRALGALFRNDDPTSATSYSALELIAFSVTNPETWLILDVLEIPRDIEMAVGDLTSPLTPFSNKPRSIRVESIYKPSVSAISTGSDTALVSAPTSIPLGTSGFIRQALEKGDSWRTRYGW